MAVLYHYANNQKAFGILSDKAIRLCDIRKSNDYEELTLLYPDIFFEIVQIYRESPFEFEYEDKTGEEALLSLINITKDIIEDNIESGGFSNFVLCFSEESDMLSQWRGYANDGQGISIGFSKEKLQKKCDEVGSVFRLEKVQYITEEQRTKIIKKEAKKIIKVLKTLRKWIVKNMTHDEKSPDTDGLLCFNFGSMVEYALTDSLRYKRIGFKEEKEWRMFLSNQAYKKPNLVLGEKRKMIGPNGFVETVDFLRNKISFTISDNNITPYVPLDFSDIDKNVIEEIWVGPKSKISPKDLELFLAQNGYIDIRICFSETSYR